MAEMVADSCDVHIWDLTEEDPILGIIEGFLVYGHPIVPGSLMDKMPRLRSLSNFGVGVDHIVLEDAQARGLPVGYTPGFVDGATADMAFTLLMALARNLVPGWLHARGPDYLAYDGNILHGHEIYGSTLGIIGMGRVGRVVARRASGFDMKILYHNRNQSPYAEELNASYRTLEALLEEADFVVLSVPMGPETRHLISTAELERMKESAFLINVARGGVVDHEALLNALQRNLIAGAAMDVTDPEPLPRDHPLLRLDNCLILPHLGSATFQTRYQMSRRTVDNLLAGLRGEEMLSRVA
ncbi:MAG: D-glycerate dehydrogenase [Caldilineaceae bacterium SB0665_bin_25]|nr:D-glycerate dehydrogenase [Caldilineaceae bacterium SB0665_bin_25]